MSQELQEYPYRVLLYYKYVPIQDPVEESRRHLEFCNSLGLKGRILFAPEGINGTVSGTIQATEAYMHAMQNDPRFSDIVWKIDPEKEHCFRKMHVRPKKELVTFRLAEDVNPLEKTGTYVEPVEFYNLMQDPDAVIVDARTDYEYDLGHFKGAIRPDVDSFRDFPKWVQDNLAQFKDKKVLTYCTGGIRCEKFSAYLLREGFKDVYQLHGGIVTYGKDPEVKGALFEGNCYVFDERVSVPVNHTEEAHLISHCVYCGTPSDLYVNCGNMDCHKQHFQCAECLEKSLCSCSEACQQAERHEHKEPYRAKYEHHRRVPRRNQTAAVK
jgi:UPF0176 protein